MPCRASHGLSLTPPAGPGMILLEIWLSFSTVDVAREEFMPLGWARCYCSGQSKENSACEKHIIHMQRANLHPGWQGNGWCQGICHHSLALGNDKDRPSGLAKMHIGRGFRQRWPLKDTSLTQGSAFAYTSELASRPGAAGCWFSLTGTFLAFLKLIKSLPSDILPPGNLRLLGDGHLCF